MDLGMMYPALAVKDIEASIAFYEKLGFALECGGVADRWCMMIAGDATRIGLYQGMFEADMLTFAAPDARAVEAKARAAGIEPHTATTGESGPTHVVLLDPDGRAVMFDQLV